MGGGSGCRKGEAAHRRDQRLDLLETDGVRMTGCPYKSAEVLDVDVEDLYVLNPLVYLRAVKLARKRVMRKPPSFR